MSETEADTSETPIEFIPFPEDVLNRIKRDFPSYEEGLIQSVRGGLVLYPRQGRHFPEMYHFPVRPDDYWVVTYPKCGTTWMQELVWLVVNDCDFEGAKMPLDMRSPFFEFPFLIPKKVAKELIEMHPNIEGALNFSTLDKIPSPRIIKSHLPVSFLPKGTLDTCKVVYVARNPKDVLVSYYYHHQLIRFHQFNGNLEAFAEYFTRGEVEYGSFFGHVLEAWNMRNHPNLLFIFYEDLKRDLKGQIEKICHFLNKPLTDDQLTRLTDHLRIDNFAKNEAVNRETYKKFGLMNKEGRFIRKGKTGDWKDQFGPELNTKIDQWIEKNLDGTDLKFITELDQQD